MTLASFKNNPPIKLLFALTVAFCWISQSAMDFFFYSLLVLILVKTHKGFWSNFKPLFKFLKFPLIMMIGYFVVAILGYVFNASTEAEALKNLSKFGWILVFLTFTMAFSIEKYSFQQLLKFFAIGFLIPALYSLNIFLNNGTDLIYQRPNYWRIIGFINSATYHGHIGGFICITLLLLIFFQIKKINYKFLPLFGAALIAVGASTFFTMTRGVWVSVAASVVLFLFVWNWKKALGIITVATLALCLVIALFVKQNLLLRADSDICRKRLIEVHLDIIKSHPWFGIGYRDNMRDLKPYWPETGECLHLRTEGTHAHNQYLNVAATTGLLGFFFFISFWIYFIVQNLRLIVKAKQQNNENLHKWSILTFTLLIYFSLANMTETDFEYGKVRLPMLAVWGCIAAMSFIELRRSEADTPEQFS